MSDDIEAKLAAAPEPDLTDPDNPEWTEADVARARRPEDVLPAEVLAAFPRTAAAVRRRGAQKAPTKKLVSIRLSQAVLDHYRAQGPGWQSRIDETLLREISRRG